MFKKVNRILLVCCVLLQGFLVKVIAQQKAPNIVLIYADDQGYGEVSCYNKEGKISTPDISALAENGIKFTDAHSPGGICSPSRYGILTRR